MKLSPKKLIGIFKTAAVDWMNDHAPRLGAAVAFYTIFSLAPLVTIVISIAGLWLSENASGQVFRELGNIVGADTAKALQETLVQPEKTGSGIFTTIAATVMLLVGATGVFIQLQDALNEIWEVKLKPGKGIINFIRHRLLSFAMILAIGFLLLVSLLLTAGLAVVGRYLAGWIGDAEWLFQALNIVLSFGVTVLLFAFIFKFMPDAKIRWSDVWVGAAFTSLLFTIGKFALGIYLGKSSLASTYGAAGSLIVVLLWVYYSAQILFYGAEVTQVYANQYGHKVQPSPHAEIDKAKKCERELTEKERERKNAIKEGKPAGKPASPARPVLGAQPAFVSANSSSGRGFGKILGGLALLLILVPLERKISAAHRSHA